MLKSRIIVTLLHDGKGNAVKPVSFNHKQMRKVGSLKQHIKVQAERDIDELILIDICASMEKRNLDFEAIKEYTALLYCPLTVGGNIHSMENIRSALNSGADKVIMKRAIWADPFFVQSASKKYGAQCLVAAYDTCQANIDVNFYRQVVENLGFGEVVLTNIMFDGKMAGYDLKLIAQLCKVAKIPVIANGGCGQIRDMQRALEAGASAVAASSMFLYTDVTPKDCAAYLHNAGFKVRV